jgi:hypothetical protein
MRSGMTTRVIAVRLPLDVWEDVRRAAELEGKAVSPWCEPYLKRAAELKLRLRVGGVHGERGDRPSGTGGGG